MAMLVITRLGIWIMVPPTHPSHPVSIEMVVIKQGFGGETWPPWNCRSSFSGTLKCQLILKKTQGVLRCLSLESISEP